MHLAWGVSDGWLVGGSNSLYAKTEGNIFVDCWLDILDQPYVYFQN